MRFTPQGWLPQSQPPAEQFPAFKLSPARAIIALRSPENAAQIPARAIVRLTIHSPIPFWRLQLVMVVHAAFAGVVVASRHVRRGGVELQKEAGVSRIVQLLTDRSKPRKCFHEISVDQDLGLSVEGVRALGGLDERLLAAHRARVGPDVLRVGPVLLQHTSARKGRNRH